MQKEGKRAPSPILTYVLFILLFLSCTAALLALCRLLGGEASALPAQEPSASTMQGNYVIVLDAGHGGEDGGAVGQAAGRDVLEKDINLSITLTLEELLREAGYSVALTRREDALLYDRSSDYQGRKKALDMAARLRVAEEAADEGMTVLFVSIHQNSFSDARYDGLQVYYSANAPASSSLAQTIQDTAREQLAPDNRRKIKPGEEIYLMKNLTCPAVLVECGFLSNPDECAALATEEYQNRVAYAIFCALREYTSTDGENHPVS